MSALRRLGAAWWNWPGLDTAPAGASTATPRCPENPPKDPANVHSVLVINAAGESGPPHLPRLQRRDISPWDRTRHQRRGHRRSVRWRRLPETPGPRLEAQVTVANLLQNAGLQLARWSSTVVASSGPGTARARCWNPGHVDKPFDAELRISWGRRSRGRRPSALSRNAGQATGETVQEPGQRTADLRSVRCRYRWRSPASCERPVGRTGPMPVRPTIRGPSVCDNGGIGKTKIIQAIAQTIRVTAADFLPEFVLAFEGSGSVRSLSARRPPATWTPTSHARRRGWTASPRLWQTRPTSVPSWPTCARRTPGWGAPDRPAESPRRGQRRR